MLHRQIEFKQQTIINVLFRSDLARVQGAVPLCDKFCPAAALL
jgi:hypothetical protein